MKEPTARKPDEIDRIAESLRATLVDLRGDYRALYPSAYIRSRSGGADGGRRHGHSDTAGAMVGGQAHIRKLVAHASWQLEQALVAVAAAKAALNDAMTAIDEDKPPIELEAEDRALTHPADRGDVDRARFAKRRRENRQRNRATPWADDEVTG